MKAPFPSASLYKYNCTGLPYRQCRPLKGACTICCSVHKTRSKNKKVAAPSSLKPLGREVLSHQARSLSCAIVGMRLQASLNLLAVSLLYFSFLCLKGLLETRLHCFEYVEVQLNPDKAVFFFFHC